MKEETKAFWVSTIVIFLIITLLVGILVGIMLLTEKQSKLLDIECQKLGYDSFTGTGFHKYCIKDGHTTEVYSSCGLTSCDVYYQ